MHARSLREGDVSPETIEEPASAERRATERRRTRKSSRALLCTLLYCTLAALGLIGCSSSNDPSADSGAARLTAEQALVLGFERPTTDWSISSGSLSESTVVTQGARAAAVVPSGWTEVTSVQLSSLGLVKDQLSIDVLVPSAPGWGEVRVVLQAPSIGLGWADLGGQSLTGRPVGVYSTLAFTLPAYVKAALEGSSSFNDLRVTVIVNGPALGSPYLLDNIDLAVGGAPGEPGEPSHEELRLVIPQERTRESMFLSASDRLLVADRVEIGVSGQLTNVASLGAPGAEFGAQLNGHTNVYSVGNVWLTSQTEVHGFVRSAGTITKQDGSVVIHGAEEPGQPVPSQIFAWSVDFPASPAPVNVIEHGMEVVLPPGAYQDLNLHGGRVVLDAGVYQFENFRAQASGEIRIQNTPVFLWVKSDFIYRGGFSYVGEANGQVLVGYLGHSPAMLEAPFVGTMVAPEATIELHRPVGGLHRGSWFGKKIHVFSDSQILPLPFDWSTLPTGPRPRDTDGDGTPDVDDPCVLDPEKVDPLLCGCHKSEVDTDQDGVPDCFDLCPNDPNNTHPGPCGCQNEGNLQPAGTPCVVQACSGSRQEAVCDGQGQCGVPACDPLPSGCVFRVFRDSGYWICAGPVSWDQADTLCRQEPGRSLVQVDDRIENLWLSHLLPSGAWLGGSDGVRPGQWYWSSHGARESVPFWVGGLPVPGRYNNWLPEAPGFDHCLAMEAGGRWSDESCSEVRAFVCEQPLRHLPPSLPPPDKCHFYPGLECPSDEPTLPAGPCVDEADAFPNVGTDEENFAEMERIAQECAQNCPLGDPAFDAPGCPDAFCTGFASVPPGPQTCSEYTTEQRVLCDLEDLHPSATCSLDAPQCPAGYTCGRRYECAALDANLQPQPCTSDAQCAAGQVCGTAAPFCMDPSLRSTCDTKVGDDCVGRCFGSFACGTVGRDCAANDDDVWLGFCSETLLCSHVADLDTNPLTDPASNLTEQEFPDTFFPRPVDPQDQYPLAKPAGCGGPGEPACSFSSGDHPWCHYQIDPEERPEGRSVSDSDPPFGDKQGTAGSAGPIQFTFDPNLSLGYEVGSPLPFGDADFRVNAEASATASAQFSLFGITGRATLLDALARLEMDRCGLVADARLALFGHDFLPLLMGDGYDRLDEVDTSAEEREACEAGIGEFTVAVDRAQKALRDAQELIRQQKELVANEMRLRPDLCEQLLEGRGLPADFPSADDPFTSCDDLSPEDTINLFIRYYQEQVADLRVAHAALYGAGKVPDFPALAIDFLPSGAGSGSEGVARRETQQIANINFVIGPLPMNLTVEVFVQYGVMGTLAFSLTPDRLLAAHRSDTLEELAAVDASITPFAGAGVSLFVGVGFDFGALSAKVGLSGDVTLGDLSLPLYARAGIGVQPDMDPRPLPADLQEMVASARLLYPNGFAKKYDYHAFYKFGANAVIKDILRGEIAAKLRIKFAFFSKSWSKKVAEFRSPFAPIDLVLVGGQHGAEFANGLGGLGGVRMPVPFVDLRELSTPPPLPPLPDPGGTGGASGTGGTSGSGGSPSSGGSGGGSGGDPSVSLFVARFEEDPRYVPFDPSRVEQFFFDGYCQCSGSGGGCQIDLDCCGAAFCSFNDRPNVSASSCLECIPPTTPEAGGGHQCTAAADCCQSDPERPNLCVPFDGTGPSYCQECRDEGQQATDVSQCCPGLRLFYGPTEEGPFTAPPVCAPECFRGAARCNVNSDCCNEQCGTDHRCVFVH